MTANEWTTTTLGNVIDIFDHKRIPLSTKQRKSRQGPYPYYGASGIIDYVDDYLFDGKYLLVSEDGANLITRNTPIAFFANGKFWVNNHAHIIRGKQGILDDYLLMSFIEGSDISGYITGTAQPKLSQQNLKAIKITFPLYPIQHKITAVLSAYDDLIENNSRRIAILEEMAQALYREWFVHFRFPGHESAEFVEVDGGNGRLPAGWEIRPLKKIAKINRESIRKGSAPHDIHYINISSVSPGKIEETEFMNFEDAPSRARRVVKHGDIIWSTVRPNRRSYALIFKPKPNTIASTGFAVITATGVPYSYLYHALTTDEFTDYLTNRATGSAYPAVNQSDFKNAEILIPPKDLLYRFDDIILDQIKLKHSLLQKNTNLHQTRDLLLPRLISGDLDVSHIQLFNT